MDVPGADRGNAGRNGAGMKDRAEVELVISGDIHKFQHSLDAVGLRGRQLADFEIANTIEGIAFFIEQVRPLADRFRGRA